MNMKHPHQTPLYNGMIILNPTSYEWPQQNFSIPHHYNIEQKSDENKEIYQLGDNIISWSNTTFPKLTS